MPFLRYYVCGAKRNERDTQDMKRIRVTDESLNAYGFWVKTSGIDLSDFKKNPIMLWNHRQGWRGTDDEVLPIGVWKDLSVNGAEITAVPEFDSEDEFAGRIAKKYEKGHLRACSLGIKILEWSDDPALLKPGQTRPTVTKCALREISVVDIPANKNAVVLYDQDGNVLNLSDTGVLNELPTLPNITTQPPGKNMEELKAIAVSLGMATTATLSEVQAEIESLKKTKGEAKTLADQLKALKDKEADAQKLEAKTLLDKALSDNVIDATQRPAYEKLFDADFESAKTILAGLKAPQKLSEVPGENGGTPGKIAHEGKSFAELSKSAPDVLLRLKENNVELFKQLYKAEYGRDYKETER